MFSLRKAEIFDRRGSRIMRAKEGGISSTETVYRITKQVDPDFHKTIEIATKIKKG